MNTKNLQRRKWMEIAGFFLFLAFVAGLCLMLSSCCNLKLYRDTNGFPTECNSWKTPLMGDLSCEETVTVTDPKTGVSTTRSTKISTSTNADKIFNAGANLIKTGINEAEKAGALMP